MAFAQELRGAAIVWSWIGDATNAPGLGVVDGGQHNLTHRCLRCQRDATVPPPPRLTQDTIRMRIKPPSSDLTFHEAALSYHTHRSHFPLSRPDPSRSRDSRPPPPAFYHVYQKNTRSLRSARPCRARGDDFELIGSAARAAGKENADRVSFIEAVRCATSQGTSRIHGHAVCSGHFSDFLSALTHQPTSQYSLVDEKASIIFNRRAAEQHRYPTPVPAPVAPSRRCR